jgi:peptide/nickel transport system permease protein
VKSIKKRAFFIQRLLYSIIALFGISILIFVIARIVPGDPARLALGPRAPQEVVDRLRKEMYLDKSIPEQYFYWLKGAVQGDFGKSLVTKRNVVDDIKDYLPATLELALFSALFMIIGAIVLGLLSARYHDKWIDIMIRISSYVGIAIPSFVLAILLLLLFGYHWPILPVLGRISSNIMSPPRVTGFMLLDSLISGNGYAFWDSFKHLLVPAFALALGSLLQEARITRSSLLDNMSKDFLVAERAYGIPERVIMFKYLLKPSLIPTVSVIGLDIASLMSNAFLVEMIFNWPGISRYGINAMLNKDLNAITAVVLIFGLVFLVINIIVDLIVSYLDPRIRLGGTREA